MWLRKLAYNGERLFKDVFGEDFNGEPEIKYLLYDECSQSLQTGDEFTTVYTLQRYWKTNEGEWKPCVGGTTLVTLETLLSNYVLIDSKLEKGIKDLQHYKIKKEEENLEQLDKFTVRNTEEVLTNVPGEPTCTILDTTNS